MDRKEGITGMRIEKFVTGPIGTNTYIVSNDETKEAFVVDMGDCPSELVGHIKKSGYEVKALLLTHGHFDPVSYTHLDVYKRQPHHQRHL